MGKGGGKKKKGKSKKGKGKSQGTTTIRGQDTQLFLKVVQIESYKQAILYYRDEYTLAKDESKKLRLALRKVQDEMYGQIRAVMAETEVLASKVASGEDDATGKLDINADSIIMEQNAIIHDLHDTIDRMIDDAEDCNQKIKELEEFQSRATDEVLHQEVIAIQSERDQRVQDREQEFVKSQARHELSVNNTIARTERIINALEGVASQKELDSMSDHALAEERLNRRLKQEVAILHQDIRILETMIQEAEDKHMDLLCNNLQVDWNFMYPEDPLDDYRLDGVNTSIVSDHEDENDDLSDVYSDNGSEETENEICNLQEITADPIYLKTYPISEAIDETMRDILELEKKHIEEGLFLLGIRGSKAQVSCQLDIGPAKFYGHIGQNNIVGS